MVLAQAGLLVAVAWLPLVAVTWLQLVIGAWMKAAVAWQAYQVPLGGWLLIQLAF
jgi:hypothetical protein